MHIFTWALAGFIALHIGVAASGLRARLVNRIGEGPYRGLFSIASLLLFLALLYGYQRMHADPFDPLNHAFWAPPEWLRWPATMLIGFGVTLAVAGLFTPGPTFVGFENKPLDQAQPARGVLRITRHPFLWGVAFWAAGHLMVNGERFALMLFGALGVMVVFGARSIDRKARARNPEAWLRFEEVTSNFPFAAIAQGRNRLALGEIGWRLLVGLAATGGIAFGHFYAFGVAAIPS